MTAAAVYLDYNANAPVKPAVREAIAETLTTGGNPSSVHRYGRLARAAVDRARDRVATMVAAEPEQVVFTSGGTEANAMAVRSAVARGAKRLLISATEHDSVMAAAFDSGIDVAELPVDSEGVLNLAALEAALAEDGPAAVLLHLANNETGVIQPVAEAADRVHATGGWLHCDAVQGPGRVPVVLGALDADTLTLSAHKIGGPQGAGALVARDPSHLAAIQMGGGQERGLRAGTENVPGICGFGVAAVLAGDDLARAADLAILRDGLESRLGRLAAELAVPFRVFGAGAPRLANTSCFALAEIPSETQVIAMDLAGVAVSAGAACSSGKVRPSHVLRAMGSEEPESGSAIRVSLGWATLEEDVDRCIAACAEIVDRRWGTEPLRAAAGK